MLIMEAIKKKKHQRKTAVSTAVNVLKEAFCVCLLQATQPSREGFLKTRRAVAAKVEPRV